MSELDRILKTLSFPQQYIEVGKNILHVLEIDKLNQTISIDPEYFNTINQTIDGKEFITELNLLYNQLPKDQLASAVFLENTPMTAHGPFGLLILTASNLGEALQCFLDYLEQMMPVFEVSKLESGHQIQVLFKLMYDFGEINHFFTEIITLAPLQIRSFLTQKTHRPIVQLIHAPLNTSAQYQESFDATFQFNQPNNALIIAKKDLNIPLSTANPTTHAWIKSQLNQQIKLLSNTKRTTTQVKRFILQSLKNNTIINTMSVAEALFMSERTLSRKLKQEGKSLSELKLEVGLEYAQLLLLDSDKSINEIALHSGFTNAVSFSRAFKRSTALTPSQYKKHKK